MYDLSGKVALVTGTSSRRGLGCSIALRLAREGADVVVTDKYIAEDTFEPWDRKEGWRGLESLVAKIEALGRQALAITTDISNSQQVNEMVENAVRKFQKIDILVNNASMTTKDLGKIPVTQLSEEAWNKALSVNLTGVFLMCKAVGNQMIKHNQGGKIVNIASMAGKRAMANRAAYSASKFGVIGLTQALALELANYKINVNAVCPGAIATWGTRGRAIYEGISQGLSEEESIKRAYADDIQEIPLGRPAMVEDLVNVVAFLASNQSDYMTGQATNVTGGWLISD